MLDGVRVLRPAEHVYAFYAGRDGERFAERRKLRALAPERILPNHGDPDVIAAGSITYFAPYQDVHRKNLETVLASR